MPVYKGNQRLKKPFTGSQRIKQAYVGNVRVFTSSNLVTYRVDTGVTYQEEVDFEASCLSPTSFTPTKQGWTFIGWRQDTVASGTVLTSLSMGENPITLYAVFRQTITVTYYNGNATARTTSGYRYYNNGNMANPSFTLTQAALSGWTARGWSAGTAGNSGITYGNGAAFTRDSNITLYGMYQQTVTVTYYNGSTSASSTSGTKYYNSNGNVVNPSFTLTQATLNGWTARGWSAGTAGNASVIYNNGATFTRDSSITLYGMYQQTVYLYTLVSGSKNTYSGNRYYNSNGNTVNPAFTVSNPSLSEATFKGWSINSESDTISYAAINNLALGSNHTVYAVFRYTDVSLQITGDVGTSERDCHWTSDDDGDTWYPEYCWGTERFPFPTGVEGKPENLPETSPYYDSSNYMFTFQSGFDASKYSALTATFSGYNHPNARLNYQWIMIRFDNVNYVLSLAWNGAGGDANHDDFNTEAKRKTITYPINSKTGTVSLQCFWITNYVDGSTFSCEIPKGTYFKLTGRTVVG